MFVSVSKVVRVAVLGSSECCLRAPDFTNEISLHVWSVYKA